MRKQMDELKSKLDHAKKEAEQARLNGGASHQALDKSQELEQLRN